VLIARGVLIDGYLHNATFVGFRYADGRIEDSPVRRHLGNDCFGIVKIERAIAVVREKE